MRLIFDENLSYKLPRLLDDIYPGSTHVRDVGLQGASDVVIWNLARGYDYIVTTKDRDYLDLSERFGSPPKVDPSSDKKRPDRNCRCCSQGSVP